jgi:predicted membrane-bound dolichyl-phosphate-mannose-protein mannosyltransferase
MLALSTLAKLTGGLGVAVVGLDWLLVRREKPVRFMVSLAIAPLLFFLLLPVLDYALTGELYDPLGRVQDILTVTRSITFSQYTNMYASRPWDWVLRPTVMPYYWDPQYVAVVSFTVGALIIPAMVCMAIAARRGNRIGLFSVSWFACTYLVWIPLSLITDRMSYVFYFYPAVGAVCLGLAWGLSTLVVRSKREETPGRRRLVISIAGFYLMFHAAILVLLTPLLSFWVSLQMAVPPA